MQQISGVEFPTGTDCVTRSPIILQLRCAEKEHVEVWIEGDPDKKSLKSNDLSKAKEFIEAATADLLDWHKDTPIVKTPIHVQISEPDLIDLTLIDLPGLTYWEH